MENRKRELDWFSIEGSYGGNQDWMIDDWMKRGGCGALTACDTCIYLAGDRQWKRIYPCDREHLTKEDYIHFGMMMKPYLSPRKKGINTLEIYMDGFREYLWDLGLDSDLTMSPLHGERSYEEAQKAVIRQIDEKLPVPCLVLHHKSKNLEDYVWHWFLLTGYELCEDTLMVKAVTYGEYQWISLAELWDTGYEEKGGLVLYSCVTKRNEVKYE